MLIIILVFQSLNLESPSKETSPTSPAINPCSEFNSPFSDVSSEESIGNKSIKLQPTYNFSCADCDFKTTNPIFLKEHRVKCHPCHQKSDSVENTSLLLVKSIPQLKKTSPIVLKRKTTPCGRTVVWYYDKEKRHNYYVCTVCNHTTANTNRLLQHQEKEHPEFNNLPLETPAAQQVKTTKEKKTRKKPPTPEAILKELEEKNIIKARKDDRTCYFCPHCSFSSHDRHRALKHVDSHLVTTPDPLKKEPDGTKLKLNCKWCEFSTNLRASLISHEKQHSSKSKRKCSLCNYASNNQSSLQTHIRRDHRSHLVSSSSESDVEHLCSQCNFKTFSHQLYAAHEVYYIFY